jgi:hypothetical protein
MARYAGLLLYAVLAIYGHAPRGGEFVRGWITEFGAAGPAHRPKERRREKAVARPSKKSRFAIASVIPSRRGQRQRCSAEHLWASIPTDTASAFAPGTADSGLAPSPVAIGGRIAEVLFFGKAPGFTGLNQVNVRVPSGILTGPSVPVRLTYIDRLSNEVIIGVK